MGKGREPISGARNRMADATAEYQHRFRAGRERIHTAATMELRKSDLAAKKYTTADDSAAGE